MKLDYKKNLKKQTPTRIELILVKLLMIDTIGSKNTFGAIVVHVISAKIEAAELKMSIFMTQLLFMISIWFHTVISQVVM